MKPVSVSYSRSVPATVAQAYEVTATASLPEVFARRYAALPPVVRVEDQDGEWAREVGQTRTICTSDGGSMRETLVDLEVPRRFAYRIDNLRGPMRPLVEHLDGRWTFDSAETRTTITWAWDIHPRSRLTWPVVIVLGRMWQGYARRALDQVEDLLARRLAG